MKCCDKQSLYVEEEPRFTGEDYGWYVVMCYECGGSDKYTYSSFDKACDRLAQLNKERESTSPNK